MAAAAYEGGAGGKFPKRSSRRAPGTPYDRPPNAARGLLRGRYAAPVGPGGSGWLSKLVEPASRIIGRGASRLFSSVFGKRLAAPPEENQQSRQEVPEMPYPNLETRNSSSEVQEKCGCGGESLIDNHGASGAQQETNPDIGGISELEQLLNQKTFTRIEFDRLTELLHSRTIEPSTPQPEVNYDNEQNTNVSEQGNHKMSTAEPNTSQPADHNDKKEKANGPGQEAAVSFRLHGSVTTPINLAIPEEAASPAEIAKAFMDSRSSKVSPSTLSLRSQLFHEDAAPYAKNSFDMAIAPRSVARFSGISELTENGYMASRSHGRSAIYRMSRSPYFKAHAMTNIRGGRPMDVYSGPSTSSQWTSTNVLQSGGKSALKRGSSVLDSDVGSLGPIRRIRQKSNLMSPSRNIHSSLPGNLLPTPSSPLSKDANKKFTPSIQKSVHLDEPKHDTTDLQNAESGYDRIPSASVIPIPPQSSEMARKILQQLDKLMPSPKEKSSEWNFISKDGLSHGRAFKSMGDADSSMFLQVQISDNLDVPSSSHLKSLRNSTFQKRERAGENGLLKPAVTGIQMTSEAHGVKTSVASAIDAKPGMRSADIATSVIPAVSSQKKPSFQMSAPEDSLDLDDDNHHIKDSSGLASTGSDKLELISECGSDHPETLEKFLGSSPRSMPGSAFVLDKRSEAKSSDRPVSEKNDAFLLDKRSEAKASNGPASEKNDSFCFPAAAFFNTSSQTTSPPMSTTSLEGSTPQEEEIACPTFKLGSKEAQSSTFSSTVTAVSNPASLKFGLSNDATSSLPDGSNSDKGGNAASSGFSSSTSPDLFAFGAPTTPTLSNGSSTPASSISMISAAPAMTFSDSLVTSVFSTSIVTSTSSGNPTASSTAPVCSMVPSFQSGSGASTGASTSVTPYPEKIGSNGFEGKSVETSSFDIICSDSLGSGSNSSASATSSVFSSIGTSSSSSVVQASPLFSSTGSGSLAQSTSSVSFSSGFPGSTASAYPSSENLSFTNSGSPSLPSAFGATAGNIFNTQATQSRTGVSNFSQSLPSQFGSFTSQPVIGLAGSSTSGLSSSLFGSATPVTKPSGTSSSFCVSSCTGSSSSSASSVPFAQTGPFGTSSVFSFSSGTVSSSSSCSSTSSAPANHFGSGSGFLFSAGAGSSSSSGSSSSFPPTAANMFNSSSVPSTSSIFGSTFGSAAPSPSTGFSFGLSVPSSGSLPFRFDTSSGPAFSFTSAGTAAANSPSPFGVQNPAVSFGSGSPGNDQMNVEDSMADDTNQASAPAVPTFGQQTNLTTTPNFTFGSPSAPSSGPSVFQFGSQQSTSIPLNPSSFQAAGNLEFAAGGSFSLGSGGGDKSGRKIVRVRRDKLRKK